MSNIVESLYRINDIELEEGYQYKGYDITVSHSDSVVYIRDSKGKVVGRADTDSEAEEFVDDLLTPKEEQLFTVKYINSVDKPQTTQVKAHNRQQAEAKVRKMPEVYRIIR